MFNINYNAYRSVVPFNSRVRFLVLHYTALNFKKSITALTGGVSAHYLVPDPTDPSYIAEGFHDVSIFNLVDEKDRAWHAGVSAWEDRNNLNDSSIGIETVNLATDEGGQFLFPEYNSIQIAAIVELTSNIIQRYPEITPTRVVGHSDIGYLRKSDPGPRFPWHTLYLRGVGAWPDDGSKSVRNDQFTCDGMPLKSDIITSFRRYGYSATDMMSEADYL